jgi:hypothetical protein
MEKACLHVFVVCSCDWRHWKNDDGKKSLNNVNTNLCISAFKEIGRKTASLAK